MAFPKNIDFDKLVTITMADIAFAMKEWLEGLPNDEVALMNRVTARLNRRRHGCDVGVNSIVKVESQLAMLHRKGINQIDQYGSDLAITVQINELNFQKTAFFQFKKSKSFEASLDRKQLTDTQKDFRTAERSFVMFADELRTGIRIKSVKDLLAEFDDTQKSKVFNAAEWNFLTQWLWGWLSCEIGAPSTEKNSPESMLQQYVMQENWLSYWESGEQISGDFLPARAWLVIFFQNR
jgi:hypothetical protein